MPPRRSSAERVGIDGVLAHLNRQADEARVPGQAVEWGFRWNDDDGSSERWWPQGITTSADATDDEDIGGRRLLMTSWYSKTVDGENQGSRITIVDIDTLEYRHVLLVVPDRTWRGLAAEAPDGARGRAGVVRALPARRRHEARAVHLPRRRHHPARGHRRSFGYRYVLPVRFGYSAEASEGVEQMRYSFLSLDRSSDPPALVAGEYGRGNETRRLVRYPLDPETQHLAAHEDGTSRPVWLDDCGLGHMQGAATVRDTYYVTASRGRYRLGKMYVGQPGQVPQPAPDPAGGSRGHHLLALDGHALVAHGVPGPPVRVRHEASPVRRGPCSRCTLLLGVVSRRSFRARYAGARSSTQGFARSSTTGIGAYPGG